MGSAARRARGWGRHRARLAPGRSGSLLPCTGRAPSLAAAPLPGLPEVPGTAAGPPSPAATCSPTPSPLVPGGPPAPHLPRRRRRPGAPQPRVPARGGAAEPCPASAPSLPHHHRPPAPRLRRAAPGGCGESPTSFRRRAAERSGCGRRSRCRCRAVSPCRRAAARRLLGRARPSAAAASSARKWRCRAAAARWAPPLTSPHEYAAAAPGAQSRRPATAPGPGRAEPRGGLRAGGAPSPGTEPQHRAPVPQGGGTREVADLPPPGPLRSPHAPACPRGEQGLGPAPTARALRGSPDPRGTHTAPLGLPCPWASPAGAPQGARPPQPSPSSGIRVPLSSFLLEQEQGEV